MVFYWYSSEDVTGAMPYNSSTFYLNSILTLSQHLLYLRLYVWDLGICPGHLPLRHLPRGQMPRGQMPKANALNFVPTLMLLVQFKRLVTVK